MAARVSVDARSTLLASLRVLIHDPADASLCGVLSISSLRVDNVFQARPPAARRKENMAADFGVEISGLVISPVYTP